MNLRGVGYALSVCAASMLLGSCGASQPPLAIPGAATPSYTAATHADRGASWISPEAKGGALLYVATGGNVFVLSYPKGKLVGSLNVAGNNLCSDQSGNVFIPTSDYEILEYAHGGTSPIQTLDAGDVPLGCAVDPGTGDLAVTQEASGAGEVAIFPNEKAPSTWYRDPDIYTFGLCGYDDRGNLFVDGNGAGNYIAELRKGNTTFVNYSLPNGFDAFGDIQWDGRHVTFSNPSTDQLYRLKFGKSSFKVVGTTTINGWQNDYSGQWPYIQTWLEGGTFIAQASSLAKLGLWSYPTGGRATKILRAFTGGNVNVYGVTVSVAPGR
jgi:hypothetical protein